MSSLTIPVTEADQHSAARFVVSAAALTGAIGCAGYISTIVLLSDLSVREAARSPLTIASNLIVACSFALLAVSLSGLRRLIGFPRWALVVASLGCAGVSATAWGIGTLAVHAAGLLTADQMEQNSAWLTLFQSPHVLPCTVGFLALAQHAWRHRPVPRFAAALLGLAGILSLLPAYPPAALTGALALAWIARTTAEEGTRAGDRAAVT